MGSYKWALNLGWMESYPIVKIKKNNPTGKQMIKLFQSTLKSLISLF